MCEKSINKWNIKQQTLVLVKNDIQISDFDISYDATDISEIQTSARAPVSSLPPAKALKNVSCIRSKIGQLEQKTSRQEAALENYEAGFKQLNRKFEPFKMEMEKYTDKKMFELKRMIENVIESNKKTMKRFENEIESVRNEHAKASNEIQHLQGQVTYVAECIAQLQNQVFGNYEITDDSRVSHKEANVKYSILSASEQTKFT
ncbi:hypothetical protein RFI_24525 [Reticulomyxa filosa]|uniref:Uncharacterized protein n=1 Tax=Reticulomyxa filosa TaxID=46433 RepID=X6MIG8_RETFI|nr:hypothetical protein RFI_24525 [Reticulomyxa filosa]|eukprot:ETO12850.1 hypothetical protein RFI_24525 [Reticulomyxa filosa]